VRAPSAVERSRVETGQAVCGALSSRRLHEDRGQPAENRRGAFGSGGVGLKRGAEAGSGTLQPVDESFDGAVQQGEAQAAAGGATSARLNAGAVPS